MAYLPYKSSGMRNEKIFKGLIKNSDLFSRGIFINPVRLFSAKKKKIKIEPIFKNAVVCSVSFFLPFSHRVNSILELQTDFFLKQILKQVKKDEEVCLWINNYNPFSYSLSKKLMPYCKKVVFDMSDDFLSFSGNDSLACLNLLKMVSSSDVLLCVNKSVARKYDHQCKIVFNNATGLLDKDYKQTDYFLDKKGKKYIGFIGGINTGRVDLDLLKMLFSEMKNDVFIFAGYSNDPQIITFINNQSNAFFWDYVEYEYLASLISLFDVAIVPHLINEHTQGNDLLKILDYMACRVPVVSTNCSDVEKFSESIHIAATPDDFVYKVKGILNGDLGTNLEAGYGYASRNSWDVKIPMLASELLKKFGN